MGIHNDTAADVLIVMCLLLCDGGWGVVCAQGIVRTIVGLTITIELVGDRRRVDVSDRSIQPVQPLKDDHCIVSASPPPRSSPRLYRVQSFPARPFV